MRAVAVTGLGIVTCLGRGIPAHRAALVDGRSGLEVLSLFSMEGLTPAPVGQIPAAHLDPTGASRSLAIALSAARDAMGTNTFERAGVLAVGTTTGGIYESEQHYSRHRGEVGRAERNLLAHHAAGTIADGVGSRLSLRGERHTFSTACSSSANAIGFGAMRVAAGAPWALVGGVDSLCRLTYGGFHALKLISDLPCQPFDQDRRGLSLGEAGAFLLLESEASARKRGATLHGFVSGWGMASDAFHMTAPHPEGRGAISAMRAALLDAGLGIEEVDYVNAHGTATPANDRAEALALRAVFGDAQPWTSSTKGMTGHTLGAAGAVEAVLSLLSMETQWLPATLGLRVPEAGLGIRHVPIGGAAANVNAVLSSSFGFGGNNTALVLTRSAPGDV